MATPEQQGRLAAMRSAIGGDRRHLLLVGRVLSYLRPHRRQALLAIACILAQALLALVPLLIFRDLIDYLGGSEAAFGHVAALAAIAFAAVAVAGLLGVAETYLAQSMAESVVADLREELFEHLIGQSLAYYTRTRTGEVMSRVLNDVGGINAVVASTLLGVVRDGIVCVTTLGLMLFFDWRLTLLVVVLVPLIALSLSRVGRVSYRARDRVQRQLAELSAHVHEILGVSGITLVKAFGRERSEHVRFQAINRELRERQVEAAMATRWFLMTLELLRAAAPLLLIVIGGWFVLHGQTSLGTVLTVSILLAARLTQSAQGLASALLAAIGSLALWQRLFEVLDEPSTIRERPGARPLTDVRGAVAFESVTFAYGDDARPALSDVSIDIEPGQLVALVGPSGAGKTTVTSLLARFYDPQSGRVLIDGHDIRDIELGSLAATLGTVFQETFLFHESLRANLLYGRPDATDAELDAAARDANIDRLVASLADGYDTIVGERGHRLSGGEKQRVAIARMFLKDPRIIVLDEATAHLDSVSEQLIQTAFDKLFRGRTAIVIAHRLSTILAADQIVVLDGGRVVETGRHHELVEAGGLYSRLYDSQFHGVPAAAQSTGVR